MTLTFGTFLTGPTEAWSRLRLTLWRGKPNLPSAEGAEVPDYLRRDLGLLPPEAPPYPMPGRVTFL
ncbi:hypothetical protein [Vannielia litorea]|uniref:Uncharacterized protein n=1 Tax=Vannielia litorea TaxID=1217970 RepID=A0A1N6DXN1_9RHOB|nr:hypothetical protein [Vannielia litorea]SIN75464.1 hypothetical protein SAMN05444002_0114 [Vannielia litorea]